MKTVRLASLTLSAVLTAALPAARPGFAAQPPSRFTCEGTRPAFELDVSREQVRYRSPEGDEVHLLGSYSAQSKYGAFLWRGAVPGQEPPLVAFGVEKACRLAETGEEHPVLLLVSPPGGGLLQGCCEPAAGPVAGEADALSIGGLARLVSASGEGVALRTRPQVADFNVALELPAQEVVALNGLRVVEGETWYLVERPQTEEVGWVPAASLEPLATPGLEEVKAGGDWSRELMFLMPAILACLDEVSPAEGAVVTSAVPRRMGMAGVRLRDAEGKRWQCIASLSTGKAGRMDEMPEGLEIPGDGDPLFTPARSKPPEGVCWERREIVDPASGERLGWLSYRQGGCEPDA
jgi:hypothetical protein